MRKRVVISDLGSRASVKSNLCRVIKTERGVFENRVLRGSGGPKREYITG
jgi:hypothetical protein